MIYGSYPHEITMSGPYGGTVELSQPRRERLQFFLHEDLRRLSREAATVQLLLSRRHAVS